MMPSVELRDVTMRFGNVVAVHDLNLRVDDGEYITILGPSGCGKTTSIKLISGLWAPTEGLVLIDGKDVDGVPIEERDIGYVFQNIALFPHMTVGENVAYGLRVRNFSGDDIQERRDEALRLVNMLQRKGMRPSELAGGDKQKVALARALASGSKLLLLDEPLSALDSRVRVDLRYEIRRIVKRLGLTVVHVTHDQEEAMSVSDRIVLMRDGTVVEVDTPEEMYRNPKRIFTANFIGETNLMEGRVVDTDTKTVTVALRNGTKVRAMAKGFNIGGAVVISVRPEYVYTASMGLAATVVGVTFMGTYQRVQTLTDSDDEVAFDISASSIVPSVGERLRLVFNKKRTVVYRMPSRGIEEAIRLE